jgi:hypothetical protein
MRKRFEEMHDVNGFVSGHGFSHAETPRIKTGL